MTDSYTYFADLAKEVQNIPPDSILSRSLLNEKAVKVTLFGFDKGQELTEHTAAFPAILYFVQGEADLTLGGDRKDAQAGTWVYMPPKLPHSLTARTPVVMLLLLLMNG
jgi:quercetin dioxygenase-like cupin family protein